MVVKNLFERIPSRLREEFFDKIISNNEIKLERIVSDGHVTQEGYWYDQDKDEFVLLVSGSAELEFEGESNVKLNPGDYLIIPSHKKHRVIKTDTKSKTIWLALHY